MSHSTVYPPVKCIVKGCSNHRSEGVFVGNLCRPCHDMITTGELGPSDSFLGKIYDEEINRERLKFKPGPPMTEDELRSLKPGDVVRHRRNGQSFQVLGNFGGRVTAVDLADVTNPNEWEVVSRSISSREIDSLLRPHLYCPTTKP